MIDEGADMVAGHGPHLLRGIELYKGRPIFYSLGNFIGQNELVPRIPADSYRKFRAPTDMTPAMVYRLRTLNDSIGFPAERRFWETILPICHLRDDGYLSIDIYPVDLGLDDGPRKRGVPRLATGEKAQRILNRLVELSRSYGTSFLVKGDKLILECGRSHHSE